MRYTDEELLDEIRRLNRELGHPPTLQDLRDHGDHSASTYYDRFGSWRDAVQAAGFEGQDPEERIETASLLNELQRLADQYRDPPSVKTLNQHGDYSVSTYQKRFGSWNNALDAAGLNQNQFDSPISEGELIVALQKLADNMDSPPTYDQMQAEGEYGARTYVRHFGSWNEALEHAGFDVQTEGEVSDAQLRDELRRVANKLGEQPSTREMAEHGKYAVATYQRHFGSWSNALTDVFDD